MNENNINTTALSGTPSTTAPPSINQEVDLLVYVKALLRAKYCIVAIAILTAALAYGYSLTKEDVYESYVRLDVVNSGDAGGVSPDNRRAPEVLTLVEHGFIMDSSKDNYLDVTLAKLRSRTFTEKFMEEKDIYKNLYAENWDPAAEQFRAGFHLDKGAAFKLFHEQIRFIDHNPLNDIVTLRMRWTDPEVITLWANEYVDYFNDYMRQVALEDVDAKLAYLSEQLERSDVVDIQKSIYRLIEAQTAVAMIANSQKEYALEVIDPAHRPIDRYAPGRKTYLIVGGFFGFFLSAAVVVGLVLLSGIRRALREHEIYPDTPQNNALSG